MRRLVLLLIVSCCLCGCAVNKYGAFHVSADYDTRYPQAYAMSVQKTWWESTWLSFTTVLTFGDDPEYATEE